MCSSPIPNLLASLLRNLPIFIAPDYHGAKSAPTAGENERLVQMSRTAAIFIFFAGLNGLLAVLAGAWATHGFGIPIVDGGDALAETGSRFQMWHALAFLGIAAAHEYTPRARSIVASLLGVRALLRLAGLALLIGIAGFSGGLYASASGTLLVGIAPIGGTALMIGWLLLALAGLGALLSRR